MAGGNKRLMKDLHQLHTDEYSSMGIYYEYNDMNIMTGKGLLFGPEGTPYEDIPLVFSVQIPSDYPFSPPNVQILTSDGVTRFHPNLYVAGKVCLSILGTWTGPKWASTMNIGTVFKSILSILNENPIINEPSWERYTLADPIAKHYAEWVEYCILRYTVRQYRNFKTLGQQETLWEPFREVFTTVWPPRWSRIKGRLTRKASETPSVTYANIPYGMAGVADWKAVAQEAAALD
jgi:ubiquitin-protein ligase